MRQWASYTMFNNHFDPKEGQTEETQAENTTPESAPQAQPDSQEGAGALAE